MEEKILFKKAPKVELENIKHIHLKDILDMQHIQELNDAFAYAMNLASTVVDIQGNAIAGPCNHSRVCQLVRSTSKGLENCMYSARRLGKKAHKIKFPYISPCFSLGFIDAAAPIIVHNQHIATWLVGQAVLADVDRDRIIQYSREIGADEDEMLKAFETMCSISMEEFERKLNFLWRVAQNVSTLGYNNFLYAIALKKLHASQDELQSYKQKLEDIVEERTKELKKALAKVEELSMRDPLTNCLNRQYLHESLEHELKRAQRYHKSVSIVICDIDHFKRINDSYGHQCGDHVLIEFAKVIKSCIRKNIDRLFRLGGEEFLLILPETDYHGANNIAERLRSSIENSIMNWEDLEIKITASFGVVSYDVQQSSQTLNSDELITSTDQNLYRAKAEGRNAVFGTKI